jgi:hypothetical protein
MRDRNDAPPYPINAISLLKTDQALVPFDVICPPEPAFWTFPLEKVMILSRGTSFSAEDHHDIDTHALYRLWV